MSPTDCELPTAGQVHHLKFSDDGRVLMAITKPYKCEPTQDCRYDIFTWDVISGCRILTYNNKSKVCNMPLEFAIPTQNPQGSHDMENIWCIPSSDGVFKLLGAIVPASNFLGLVLRVLGSGRVRMPSNLKTPSDDGIGAIALFANQPSFAAITTQEIRIGSYEAGRYEARSKSTCDEFLDVVVSREGDGDELILIGRSNSRGKIRAFRLQMSKVDGLRSVGKGFDTGLGGYNPMTDCCCLFREPGYGKQGMLIAKIKGRENEGKLSHCHLD